MNEKLDMTEAPLPEADELDCMSIEAVLRLMNAEDQKVAVAIAQVIPVIAMAVDIIVSRLRAGGRLIYVGAGTSGRLGILDAAECPPTFGVSSDQVLGIIAGGPDALVSALEGVEDDAAGGERDVLAVARPADTVVGLSASGRTPYTVSAVRAARRLGVVTVAVACNPGSPLAQAAELAIEVPVGPEVIQGSTRLKAGTAQKLVLNMLSTATMVRLGRVYRNYMVDMQALNEKLRRRAVLIVQLATGASPEEAVQVLAAAGWHVKLAVVMYLAQVGAGPAQEALDASGGSTRGAIERLRPVHSPGCADG